MTISNCCGATLEPHINPTDNIPMSKSETALKIYEFMDSAIKQGGPALSMTTNQIREAVDLHREYFGSNVNHAIMADCKQAIFDLKTFYFQYRAGNIKIVEDEVFPDPPPEAEKSLNTLEPPEAEKSLNTLEPAESRDILSGPAIDYEKLDKRSKAYKEYKHGNKEKETNSKT